MAQKKPKSATQSRKATAYAAKLQKLYIDITEKGRNRYDIEVRRRCQLSPFYYGDSGTLRCIVTKANDGDRHYFLRGVSDFIPQLCELPDAYSYGMFIRGVKFDYQGSNQIMAASIIVEKHLKHSAGFYRIETPMKPSTAKKKKDNDLTVLPEAVAARLELLIEYAEGYINGDRADIPLIPEENKAPSVPAMSVSTKPVQQDLIHQSVSVAS